MTNTGTSGIQHRDKNFFDKTYRRYFNFFFLWADRRGICVEYVIFFYRFSFTSAKYFTVYFRRANESASRVAYLILYITVDVIMKQLWVAYVKAYKNTLQQLRVQEFK